MGNSKFPKDTLAVYENPFSILVPMANKLGLLYNFISFNSEIFEKSDKNN